MSNFTRTALLTTFGLISFGLFNAKAQSKKIDVGDAVVFIEHLTSSKANDRKVARINSAKAENKITQNWNADDFKTNNKQLEKDYEIIKRGLTKKGIEFKEIDENNFNASIPKNDNKILFITIDYSVSGEKRFLVITTWFQLRSAKKDILLEDAAKGILMQIDRAN